ncbi:hypothetical protein ONO23_04373 [Micromonospora noduli]|nr:hypothetical protein ONO23_04373 [Micromonospora noduli]
MPPPGASGRNRRTSGRPLCAASSAPASSVGRSAGTSAVIPATHPVAALAAPCRNAAFRPASGSSGSTRAPEARAAAATRASSVTTTASATAGQASTARSVSAARASANSSCGTPGSAPRSRLLATASRFTGTTTAHLG